MVRFISTKPKLPTVKVNRKLSLERANGVVEPMRIWRICGPTNHIQPTTASTRVKCIKENMTVLTFYQTNLLYIRPIRCDFMAHIY